MEGMRASLGWSVSLGPCFVGKASPGVLAGLLWAQSSRQDALSAQLHGLLLFALELEGVGM